MIRRLPEDVLEAVLETIPVEFRVVDDNDKVRAGNNHDTLIFKRQVSVLGIDVHDGHPKKSIQKVGQILQGMKQGKTDKSRFRIDLHTGENSGKEKVLIKYHALRNKNCK